MIKQELTYWVTLALMPKIWNKRKNERTQSKTKRFG